jgi:hypothetical protein
MRRLGWVIGQAVTDWTTSGFDSSKGTASQTVTVSYTEGRVTKTATFTVTIIEAITGSLTGTAVGDSKFTGNGDRREAWESHGKTTVEGAGRGCIRGGKGATRWRWKRGAWRF